MGLLVPRFGDSLGLFPIEDRPMPGANETERNCRIRVYQGGTPQGFLCHGGKLNRLRVHASLLTRADAEKAIATLEAKPEIQSKGATFKIVEGAAR